MFITGPELSVPNAVEEDSGVYQCFAYNPAGNDSSAAVVRVLSELICGVWYRVYTKQDVLLHDHYTPDTSHCVCTMDTGLAPTTEFVIVRYTVCAASLLVTFLSLPSSPSVPLPPFLSLRSSPFLPLPPPLQLYQQTSLVMVLSQTRWPSWDNRL